MDLNVQRCRVYASNGELETTRTRPHERQVVPRAPTIADRIPVSEIMTRDVVCARPTISVTALTELLVKNHIGCVPIVNERGHAVGMVTKLDLVERSWPGITAADVMMPLAITLDQHATIAHAAAVMSLEDFHHVMVLGPDRTLVGVVSTMDIVRWLARNDGFTGD